MNTQSSGIFAPGPSRPSGYLVWVRDGVLMAQPFDHQNVRLMGKPAALPEAVAFNASGSKLAQISASADGTLLYSPARKPISQLSWLGRNVVSLGSSANPIRGCGRESLELASVLLSIALK